MAKNRPTQPQYVPSVPVKMSAPDPVPEYLRCPCCFTGWGGVGVDNGRYDAKRRVYLKCNKCSHSWVAEIKVTVEVLRVDFRVPHGIQTRDGQ